MTQLISVRSVNFEFISLSKYIFKLIGCNINNSYFFKSGNETMMKKIIFQHFSRGETHEKLTF